MVVKRVALLAVMGAGLGLGGCTGEELDGFIWQNTLTGAVDTCHEEGAGTPYQEIFNYRLTFEGSFVDLNIGANTFATGTVSGCEIEYDSVVWGETVDGYELRWRLLGEGTVRYGGSTCALEPGIDWNGTETFEIVYSEHPDYAVGCEYEMTVVGSYLGPAGG